MRKAVRSRVFSEDREVGEGREKGRTESGLTGWVYYDSINYGNRLISCYSPDI